MSRQSQDKLAVLISGSGTLLDAMGEANLPIEVVFADRPCAGANNARAAGQNVVMIDRTDWGWDLSRSYKDQPGFDREGFSRAYAEALNTTGITIAAMAGFMTIFSPVFFSVFRGTLLNIHPALLPAFKGEHAVADALAAGVDETGTTVHVATTVLDDGPILAQRTVPILEGDTVETLHERIKKTERPLYVEVLRNILEHGLGYYQG